MALTTCGCVTYFGKRLSAKPFDACDMICRFDGGTWVAIVSLITVDAPVDFGACRSYGLPIV